MAEIKSEYVMTIVTDPEEIARCTAQAKQYDRNMAWLQARAPGIYDEHRGQHIVIAGEELFAAPTAEEAMTLARAAHPDDAGMFIMYIHKEKMPRIYHAH